MDPATQSNFLANLVHIYNPSLSEAQLSDIRNSTSGRQRNARNEENTVKQVIIPKKFKNARNEKHNNVKTGSTTKKHKKPKIESDDEDDAFLDYGDEKYECPICLTEQFVNTGRVTCSDYFGDNESPEKHSTCIPCFRKWAHTADAHGVARGGIGMDCPYECKNVVLISKYFRCVDDEKMESLMRQMQRRCIVDAAMPDYVRCINCAEEFVADDCGHFVCGSCNFDQCSSCYRPYDNVHQTRTCAEVTTYLDKLRIRTAQAKSAQTIEYQMSEITTRKCPKCPARILKSDGCNHVRCTMCGTHFCYICGVQLPETNTYAHFKQGQCGQNEDPAVREAQRIASLRM